ncbi:MAG TPA: Lpg1974 family pore-forming outer membrane protein [Rhabdochlamydiaceae bacterium]|nr:Lpg1974 family pore-forming outer membrane protein [Rhabdochlamydiaceae bacterium]
MKRIILTCAALTCAVLSASDSTSLINSYYPAVKDGVDVWIGVDILYWKPWERALVATNKESDVFTTTDFTQAPVVHPRFHWSLGYRISGGYLFPCNLWNVESSWTHFTSHVSQHRSSHDSAFIGTFPIWSMADDVIAGDYVFESKLNWKFTINMIDVQFGRYLNVFHRLDLNPFFGLRSAWIKQHGDVVYEGGMFLIGIIEPGISLNGTDFIKMKNNYWGLGPRVGIAPRFIVWNGLSLNAEAAISGLYGFFKIHQKETYLDTIHFSNHEHLNRFRWIADFAAGVQWKVLFCDERYALTFKTDWEYHIFVHQFELKKDDFDLVPENRNLSTQGVTFSVRFDF